MSGSWLTKNLRFVCISFCVFTAISCGGGGSDDAVAPAIIPPILVNAGQNMSVVEQSLNELSGNATGGDGALTYVWTSNPTIEIVDADSSDGNASFTAPTVVQNSTYLLTLTVTDQAGNQANDNVSVDVVPINFAPTAVIDVTQNPLYQANSFPVMESVSLSAANSTDPDLQTNSDEQLTYLWQQTFGEPVLQNSATDQVTLVFDTPLSQIDHDIGISLTVSDQQGETSTAVVELVLLGLDQTLPTISVGTGATVLSGEKINLASIASTSAPDAVPFEYLWTVVGSQPSIAMPVSFDNAASANTFAIAPDVTTSSVMTFAVEATDRYGNTISATVEHTVLPTTQVRVNDTGVYLDANEDTVTASYQADYPGQDSHRGKDAIAQGGLQIKAGRGEQGFDFTRLNQNGDEVDDITQPWRCVRDNVTGLVWENKTDNSADLHFVEQTFTWFLEAENGDFEGHVNPASNSCNLVSDECNTLAFVAAVNAEGLCGFFDWRLPSHNELMSIVHYGKTQSPLADANYFRYVGSSQQQPLWYWTLQPSIDGVTDTGAQNAWAIDFSTGVDNFLNKATEQRVRLVRAGR